MLRLLPPIAVLALAAIACYVIFRTEPEPRKMPRGEALPKVEARALFPTDYQVLLQSQGTVQARTTTALVAEARGRITSVSPAFQTGGFFEEGDLLLEIDPRDYETEVVIAEANLASARLALAEEEARANQAQIDWDRFQPDEAATKLALRLPQLDQARTSVASAEARLANAKLNLQRTQITAPFVGRVLQKSSDVGQYVSTGTRLATLYAIDYAEIRLPLKERQLEHFDLPASYRDSSDIAPEAFPEVTLASTIGSQSYDWQGKVVRAEGAFDPSSRQLFVVAQVDDPYSMRQDGRPPLKVGSFVEATITGDLLENVFVIPRELHRKNEYIVLIDKDNQLTRRAIDVIWSDEENLIVRSGIEVGERVCLTPLRFPAEGMKVDIASEESQRPPVPFTARSDS